MVKLGDRVKDSITGFAGIAIARCEYLNGCVRVSIQPVKLKDGKPIDELWVDESQLVGYKKCKPREGGANPIKLSNPI